MNRAGLLLSALTLAAAPLHSQTFYHQPDIAQAQTGFGGAVAVSGDLVIVGEPLNDITAGAVYLYRKAPGRATWAEASRLTAREGKPGDDRPQPVSQGRPDVPVNYVAGLRVIDISDPTNPKEVGYFDTVPTGENTPGFGGSWSNYPYFKNGVVGITSRREGLFLVRPRPSPHSPLP